MTATSIVDVFEVRLDDYGLDEEQTELQVLVRRFFTDQCPPDVVKAAGDRHFDSQLWAKLLPLGLLRLSLPQWAAGDERGLADLTVVVEEHGRALAPTPFLETVVGSRHLARCRWPGLGTLLETIESEGRAISISMNPWRLVDPPVPAVPVITALLDAAEDGVLLYDAVTAPTDDSAGAPMVPLSSLIAGPGVEVGTGGARLLGVELRLLTASALIGLAARAHEEAVDFARTRETKGIVIGGLQAVAHPLADGVMQIDTARRLVRRAAWFVDHEPARGLLLAEVAYATAAQAALEVCATAVHVQGGQGLSLESLASMCLKHVRHLVLNTGTADQAISRLGARLDDDHAPAYGG
jgi:alkylation response protein AidB-like acyl-CoA dehydrogenase